MKALKYIASFLISSLVISNNLWADNGNVEGVNLDKLFYCFVIGKIPGGSTKADNLPQFEGLNREQHRSISPNFVRIIPMQCIGYDDKGKVIVARYNTYAYCASIEISPMDCFENKILTTMANESDDKRADIILAKKDAFLSPSPRIVFFSDPYDNGSVVAAIFKNNPASYEGSSFSIPNETMDKVLKNFLYRCNGPTQIDSIECSDSNPNEPIDGEYHVPGAVSMTTDDSKEDSNAASLIKKIRVCRCPGATLRDGSMGIADHGYNFAGGS